MTDPASWTARFVGAGIAHDRAGAAAPYIRTEFEVDEGLRSATLHVTARGVAETHLNGAVVGDEVLCPGWTSYEHRLLVSSHDVSAQVSKGPNAVGAVVGEGWAVGRIGHVGARNHWADRPALLLRIELDYGDRIEVVETDESWRVGTGGTLSDGIYDGETYDARLEPAGWAEPGFDDGGWDPVTVLDDDVSILELRSSPPVRRTEELAPIAIESSPSGKIVADFGQIIAGRVRMRVTGPAGTTVTIRHTELLVDGEPDFEPNRTAEATDRFTLAGAGLEIWEPRFTFHGFRYAIIEGWPGGMPDTADLTGVVIHSDLPRTGWFECSDERLNQLHRNIVWSWRGNSVAVPTDCPQRDERLGWTGDINAFAPTAAYLFDVSDFLGSWLADLRAEQAEQGVVPVVVPDVLRMVRTETALWGDVAVSLPWLLYRQYGDLAQLETAYPSMTAFIESAMNGVDSRGIWSRGFQFGDWLDPDAPPDRPAKSKAESALVATAYLCRTTSEISKAASVLGESADAARFADLHRRIRDGFRHEWVTESGRLANESQTSYSLAICFGLFDADQERRAGARLVELVREAKFRIGTGFAGTPWLLHALSRTGHDDIAYRVLLETEPPSFLYAVEMGATTIWERWDSVLPDGQLNSTGMTSLNHYAFGAVGQWLHQRVGGIELVEPGFREVKVAPRPGGGLTWAATSLQSPRGLFSVRWIDHDLDREVEVEIPEGSRATVVLPDHREGLVAEVGPGRHHWTYEIPAEESVSLSTPFEVLRKNEAVWSAIDEVMSTVMPGVPDLLDHVAESAPNLAVVLPHLPDAPDGLEEAVGAAIAGATT